MSDLIAGCAEASAWVERTIAALNRNGTFGKIVSAVVWSDATAPDGELLVDADPAKLVASINTTDYLILRGHDPGFPLGKVLAAEAFTGADGTRFVAAIFGLYNGARLSFHNLGLDASPAIALPIRLPAIPDTCWIDIATDPREVDAEWVADVARAAPLRVETSESSHNAADSVHALITLGVLFMIAVWNPFVKAFATEAGKDAYAAVHDWFRHLFKKMGELHDPILEVQTYHNGCYVSFMFRGKDVSLHYAAHETWCAAAREAEYLIANMKERGYPPMRLLYEFHAETKKWFPSYAKLHDGRLVTDNRLLIAAEQLPSGVSLGIIRKGTPRVPSVKETGDKC